MDSSLSSDDSDDEGIGDKEKKKILKKKKKRVRVSSLAGRCAAPEGPAVALQRSKCPSAVQHGRTGDNLSVFNQQIPRRGYFALTYPH